MVFLLDELQFLQTEDLEALILALHKTTQRILPITLVGAGLPQVPELTGEAKSYSERLFTFPHIGRLPDPAAAEALGYEKSEQLGPTRANLINKGLVYTPGHGLAEFTVPQFDKYLRRRFPLETRTPRKRDR